MAGDHAFGSWGEEVIVQDWHRRLAERHRTFVEGATPQVRRRGALAHIDDRARTRALASVTEALPVSLERPLQSGREVAGDREDWDGYEFSIEEEEVGRVTVYSDELRLNCHGALNTHIDALNHILFEGRTYGDWTSADVLEGRGPAVDDWAVTPILTRGCFADIATVRGQSVIDADSPITGEEIEAAVGSTGLTFEPGDALLLYGGRDAFEEEGNTFIRGPRATRRPGIGRDGGEWIADNRVSVLCWDFLDAIHPEETPLVVHMLSWAVGLVIVDSCDFSRVRTELAKRNRGSGMLVIAPLAIPGGTGSAVNPLLVL